MYFKTAMRFVLVVAFVFYLHLPAHSATFTVTRTDDPVPNGCAVGDCSLREAVSAANASAGDDTLQVPAGTYLLTIAGNENNNATGDLDIKDTSGKTTITGAGPDSTIIDASAVNERAIHVNVNASLDMTGVQLTGGNTAVGGGLRNNTATVTISNSKITGNTASGTGGAGVANLNGSTLTLTNTEISGNTGGTNGGGIFNNNSSILNINGGAISLNTAKHGGGININTGTVNLSSVTFDQNTANNGFGGGIFNKGGTVVVDRSTFSKNKATMTTGRGGAIFHQNAPPMTISNSAFTENQSSISGGAIQNQLGMSINISNSTFTGNTSQQGGAVYCNSGSTINDTGSTYNANIATGNGGAFHCTTGAQLNLTNATLSQNQGQSGGAVYLFSINSCSIENSTINSNTATTGNGGGLYKEGGGTVDIKDSTVSNNKSSNTTGGGGGIYSHSGGPVQFTSSTLSGNTAFIFGGGVYTGTNGIFYSTDSVISGNTAQYGGGINSGYVTQLMRTTVSANTADINGGGIWHNSSFILQLDYSKVQNNTAKGMASGAGRGGGIYEQGTVALINYSEISGNTATGTAGNNSGQGGGIYNNGANLIISRSTISQNSVSTTGSGTFNALGGGIYNKGFLSMDESTVSGNTATAGPGSLSGAGGGIFHTSPLSTVLNASTISGNRAIGSAAQTTGQGGGVALFLSSGQTVLDSCTVSGNTATGQNNTSGFGAGVFSFNSPLVLHSSTLTLNNSTTTEANKTGGGLHHQGPGSTTQISYTILSDNLPEDCFKVTGSGAINSADANIIKDGSPTCGAASPPNLFVDPLLGPLTDNGGWTLTHMPLTGSPAIDAVSSGGLEDQRSVPRPQGSDYDIGAVETSAQAHATITKTGTITGGGITYLIEVTNIGTVDLTDTKVFDTVPFTPISANFVTTAGCTISGYLVTCNLGDLTPGETRRIEIKTEYTPTSCDPIINYAYLQTANLPTQSAHNVLYPLNCDTGGSDITPKSPYKRNVPGNDPDVYNTGWENGGSFVEGHNWGGLATPISYTFTGSRIDVRANLGPLFGKVKIYIDGVFVGEIDLFSTDPLTDQVIFSTLVGEGEHTIEIVPVASPPGITVQITGFTIYN